MKDPFGEGVLLLNINQVAALLGQKRQTVYNNLSKGTFPLKPGHFGRSLRWKKADVLKYIDKCMG